jgi:hypothetical protein
VRLRTSPHRVAQNASALAIHDPAFAPRFQALYTTNLQLGALGLVPKHSFLSSFDFGDSYEFEVKILALVPREAGDYPRLVEAKGQAPRQYHRWDDEGDLEAGDKGCPEPVAEAHCA